MRLKGHATGAAGQGLLLIGSTALSGAVGLVFWTVVAWTAEPETVGRLAVATSLGQLGGVLGGAGIGAFIIQSLPTVRRPGRTLALAVSLPAGAAAVLGTLIARTAGLTGAEAGLAITSATLIAAGYALDAVLISQNRAEQLGVRQVLFGAVRIGLVLSGVGSLEQVWVAGLTASTLYAAVAVTRVGLPRADGAVRRTPDLREPLWQHLVTLTLAAPALTIPYLVDQGAGSGEAATFHLAWQLAAIAHVVAPALAAGALARAGKDPGRREEHLRTARRLTLRMTVLAVGGTAGAGPVFAAILGPGYPGLSRSVAAAAVAAAGSGLTILTITRLRGEGRFALAWAVAGTGSAVLLLTAGAAAPDGAATVAGALAAAHLLVGTGAWLLDRTDLRTRARKTPA